MSLRWKIALAMAAIATLATVAFGVGSYRTTRDRLYAEVDRSLIELDGVVGGRRPGLDLGHDQPLEHNPLAGFAAQVIGSDGVVLQSTFPETLTVTDAELRLIGNPRSSTFRTVDTSAGEYRVRAVGLPRQVVQIGRPLDETNRVLRSLRARSMVLALLVAAAAAGAGLWIASRVTASRRRLTLAAETVESTGRLDVKTYEGGNDEVGRLGEAFDRMLAALARSKDDQHRLVQDAGHELRTPLTSLRTNLDSLRRYPDMGDMDREAIIGDLHAETEELTELVNELVAVASGEVENELPEPFDLGVLAADVATRYERRTGRQIVVVAEPTSVTAQRAGVQRALSCLLDNARKFDSSDGPIEVTVHDGVVAVADRGVGIPEHEIQLIFERFHRADEARTLPGSGLGLSIVGEVARRHGGYAFARNRDGGGAVVGFSLQPQS